MKRNYALPLILALPLMFTQFASGQTITMPAEVKVPVGRLAAVPIQYDGDEIKFIAPTDMDVFREYDPDPKSLRLRLLAYTAGKYRVVVGVCKDKKLILQECVIIVGDSKPPPTNGIAKHLTFVHPTQVGATVVNDGSLREFLRVSGISVHVLLPTEVLPSGFSEAVRMAGGTPCIVIQDHRGSVLTQAKLTTSKAVEETVAIYLGN